MRWGLAIVVMLVACEDPPPPPLVAPRVTAPPPRPPPIEPVKEKEVELPPHPPELVAAFPDELHVTEDVEDDEQLMQLLKLDPARAEAALQKLEAPDAWKVSIIAQLALTRGEKSFEQEAEQELPPPVATAEPIEGAGAAWVSTEAPLLSTGKKVTTLATLPVNTKVEVTAIDGEWAEVSVPVAQTAIYGEAGSSPVRVTSSPLTGRVRAEQLARKPYDIDVLLRSALARDDTDEGHLRAVSTWLLASRVERSERTREGLLRAAFTARRASLVVKAALAKNLAPASGVRFAWSCTGDDPPSAPWLELTKTRPKTLPPAVCVSGIDARERCADDTPAALKKAAATKEWLEAVKLSPRPWLRFTVDARAPRQVLVVTTPLSVADPCSEFEEVTFEAASGQVRRLSLPLGTKAMTIWVPLSRHSGAEFAIPSTASESQAISWLRARGHYRWTVGGKGELQPSLGVNARGFEVPEDVMAAGFAVAPERDCSCQ